MTDPDDTDPTSPDDPPRITAGALSTGWSVGPATTTWTAGPLTTRPAQDEQETP